MNIHIEELLPIPGEEYLKKINEIIGVHRQVQIDTYPNPLYDLATEDIEKDLLNHQDKFLNNWIKDREKWGKEYLGLLAYDTNKLVGFSTAAKQIFYYDNPNNPSETIEKEKVWIGNIFILREYQGNHIGSQLMKKIIEWSNGLPILLKVVSYNTQAINFYKSFGFEYAHDTKEEDYNGKKIPQICMSKEY